MLGGGDDISISIISGRHSDAAPEEEEEERTGWTVTYIRDPNMDANMRLRGPEV